MKEKKISLSNWKFLKLVSRWNSNKIIELKISLKVEGWSLIDDTWIKILVKVACLHKVGTSTKDDENF